MATLKYEANSSFQTGTLASGYTSGGGSLALTSGHGDRFPSSGDFWVRVDSEVFKVTARTGDTLTVTGAADGTSAANHSAGATVRWVLGVAALTQLRTDMEGRKLLQTQTASASATLDFTSSISSEYDEYEIEFINVIPATDEANLYMRMSTDGGANYDAGNNYGWAHIAWRSGGSAVTGAENGVAQIQITSSGIDSGASTSAGVTGSIKLFGPGSSALFKQVAGKSYAFGATFHIGYEIIGSYQVATAVNAVRFLMSAGNITSGSIRVYGLKK